MHINALAPTKPQRVSRWFRRKNHSGHSNRARHEMTRFHKLLAQKAERSER